MSPERAGEVCDQLDKHLRGSHYSLSGVANLVVTILKEEAWRARRVRTGEVVECESFLELLTSPPLKGYGEDPSKVEALLKDDPEALTMFRQAVTPRPGGDRKSAKAKANSNNITIESARGTTRAYTLDRLQRKAPDLYKQVIAGTLSANAAAQQAGFRPKTVTVQPTVEGFVRAAVRCLDGPSLVELRHRLEAAEGAS